MTRGRSTSHYSHGLIHYLLPRSSRDDIWATCFWQVCPWLKYWELWGMSPEGRKGLEKSQSYFLRCRNPSEPAECGFARVSENVAQLFCTYTRLASLYTRAHIHAHTCAVTEESLRSYGELSRSHTPCDNSAGKQRKEKCYSKPYLPYGLLHNFRQILGLVLRVMGVPIISRPWKWAGQVS